MRIFCALAFLLVVSVANGQAVTETYPVDPASEVHEGVPKGEVMKFTLDSSKIFPGTSRDYWVYVPAQYKAEKPACVYVNQDGIQWNAPVVFDNLINSGDMPVTIGVFVMHGKVKASSDEAVDRFNRSFEYDGLGDNYARFILDELLPLIEGTKTSDGRIIHLSKNGNDRAIGGSSSGAVCAFTAAWERPEAFSRVFSTIGTYVGLRGADRYPTLIRKFEPKPLRIYLQDGANDLNIYAGDWWMANQMMLRALTFAGYEVTYQWGEGGHNGKQGTALFPAAMKYLWNEWPKPVARGNSQNQFLSALLLPNEDWQLVGEGYRFTEGPSANASGEVFFQDIPNNKTYKSSEKGGLTLVNEDTKNATSIEFDKDGNRYEYAREIASVLKYSPKGKKDVIVKDVLGNDLTVAFNGNIYLTAPDGREKPSSIFLIRPNGEKVLVDSGILFANGVALSPDQTTLYVTESTSHWVYAYHIQPDGLLVGKQKYGWLHVRDQDNNAWPDGLTCDSEGRVYVATKAGIQILDQTGRVNAILPTPNGNASNVAFGGANFDVLYVTANDKVYKRKLKTTGANNWARPFKPAAPKL